MTATARQPDLRKLPKVELHLHLDCSLSYQAVQVLAPSVTLEDYNRDFVAPAKCTNLADFLTRAIKGFALMQTPESLRLVTKDLFRQLCDDGVIYAEIRFAPLLHTENGLTPARVVEIVDAEVEDMIAQTGVEARLILCTLRHLSEAQSLETARLVQQFAGSHVVALDLAADEAGFPIEPHVAAYRFAVERGIYRTAHAGEALGPASVWETLRLLQPSRIGHGVRSIEDPALVRHLADHAIHLEICPSSNVQVIPSINDWNEHPIDRLYHAGVRLNVNTDARMLTPDVTLTSEYRGLQNTFGWSLADLGNTNLMAIDAAFLDEESRQRLRDRIAPAYVS